LKACEGAVGGTGATRHIEPVSNLLAPVPRRAALPRNIKVGLAVELPVVNVHVNARETIHAGRGDSCPVRLRKVPELVGSTSLTVVDDSGTDLVLLRAHRGSSKGSIRESRSDPANAGRFPHLLDRDRDARAGLTSRHNRNRKFRVRDGAELLNHGDVPRNARAGRWQHRGSCGGPGRLF
jgi:hypothetical protein